MRCEVDRLRMERDILKKAAAFFTKESYEIWLHSGGEDAVSSRDVVSGMAVARSGFHPWLGRPHQQLQARGIRVGHHRVARLMRLHGLRGIYRPILAATTVPLEMAAANDCSGPSRPRARITNGRATSTYIASREGWLYLA